MSAGTALKKINARAKQLKKLHPGKKYRTLQKQAGSEYRAGKMPKKRKPAKSRKRATVASKRKRRVGSSGNTRTATKASTSRNRTSTKTVTAHIKVGRHKRKRAKAHKPAVRRRVGSKKSNTGLLIGLGVLAVGAILLLKQKTAVPPLPVALAARPSATSNAAASSILQYAALAGATIPALTALVNALNNMSDSQVSQAAPAVNAGTLSPDEVAMGYYNPYEVSTINDV